MSDTPKTDSASDWWPEPGQRHGKWPEIVPAEFARTLERENATLNRNYDCAKMAAREEVGGLWEEIENLRTENAAMRDLLFRFSCNTACARDAHDYLSNTQEHLTTP